MLLAACSRISNIMITGIFPPYVIFLLDCTWSDIYLLHCDMVYSGLNQSLWDFTPVTLAEVS